MPDANLDRVQRTMDRVAALRVRLTKDANEALQAPHSGLLAFAVYMGRQVDADVAELEAVCTSADVWAPDLGAGLRATHLVEAREEQRRLWDALDGALRAAEGQLNDMREGVTP